MCPLGIGDRQIDTLTLTDEISSRYGMDHRSFAPQQADAQKISDEENEERRNFVRASVGRKENPFCGLMSTTIIVSAEDFTTGGGRKNLRSWYPNGREPNQRFFFLSLSLIHGRMAWGVQRGRRRLQFTHLAGGPSLKRKRPARRAV
jgi:hypothetical protein